jgi:hypothetical protein
VSHFRWEADSKIEIHRERPSKRFVVMTLGGYWPRLLKLRDGRLMVVARDGDLHLGLRGRIVCCYSPDGGESWSQTREIAGEGLDNRDPAVIQLSSGQLLIAYHSHTAHEYRDGAVRVRREPKSPNDLLFRRSDNGGETWSQPWSIPTIELDSKGIDAKARVVEVIPYRMVEMPDGTIVLGFHADVYGDNDEVHPTAAYTSRSRDGGQTWTAPTYLSDYTEPALLWLPGGKLLAALRHDSPQEPGLSIAESYDLGDTWTTPVPVTGSVEHPGDLLRLKDGRILLTFGRRQPPYGIRALLSYDDGKTWDQENRIVLAADSASRDCGYPSSVQLDTEEIVTVYYTYESHGPFQALPGQAMGIHAQAIKYKAGDLP